MLLKKKRQGSRNTQREKFCSLPFYYVVSHHPVLPLYTYIYHQVQYGNVQIIYLNENWCVIAKFVSQSSRNHRLGEVFRCKIWVDGEGGYEESFFEWNQKRAECTCALPHKIYCQLNAKLLRIRGFFSNLKCRNPQLQIQNTFLPTQSAILRSNRAMVAFFENITHSAKIQSQSAAANGIIHLSIRPDICAALGRRGRTGNSRIQLQSTVWRARR